MRRSLAVTTCALVLAVPTLSSCGFNYATDEIYTTSAGTDIRSSRVDVLNAVIVADQDNVGNFVATFSNNETTKGDKVVAISGGPEDTTFAATGFKPIPIVKGGFVALSRSGGVPVSGDFKPGDFVQVSIDFQNAESVTFNVPVVPAEGPYASLAPAPASNF
jgi:hypothetical protein